MSIRAHKGFSRTTGASSTGSLLADKLTPSIDQQLRPFLSLSTFISSYSPRLIETSFDGQRLSF